MKAVTRVDSRTRTRTPYTCVHKFGLSVTHGVESGVLPAPRSGLKSLLPRRSLSDAYKLVSHKRRPPSATGAGTRTRTIRAEASGDAIYTQGDKKLSDRPHHGTQTQGARGRAGLGLQTITPAVRASRTPRGPRPDGRLPRAILHANPILTHPSPAPSRDTPGVSPARNPARRATIAYRTPPHGTFTSRPSPCEGVRIPHGRATRRVRYNPPRKRQNPGGGE